MPELEDIQRQIHGEISSLQENLKSLNTIRLEFEQAKNLVKEHITKVDEYIRSIQTHSTNLQNLLLRYADEIKEHTIQEINRAISSLEAVSNEIIRTVNSLKEEIKEGTGCSHYSATQARNGKHWSSKTTALFFHR